MQTRFDQQLRYPMEDDLLRFSYEAKIGEGMFDTLVKRLRWNYEATIEPRPRQDAPNTSNYTCEETGYIKPFLDCSLFFCGSEDASATTKKATKEDEEEEASSPTEWLPLSVPSRTRAQLTRCFGARPKPSDPHRASTANKEESRWLETTLDRALLDLEELLDEELLSSARYRGIVGLPFLPSSIPPGRRSTKSKMSRLQFLSCVTTSGQQQQQQELPWPWISSPSKTGAAPATKTESTESSLPPPHSLSCGRVSASNRVSSEFPAERRFWLPLLHPRSRIPVLEPLGLHRLPGGERVLNGPGVNHANLIQVVGQPTCPGQPFLVQGARGGCYVNWKKWIRIRRPFPNGK